MQNLIAASNELSSAWGSVMWAALWQSAVLAGMLFLFSLLLRRASASLRFWLWMLIPLRLLVMPFLTISVPVLAPPESPAPAMVVQGDAVPIPIPASVSSIETDSPPGDAATASRDAGMAKTETQANAVSAPSVLPRGMTWLMGAWLLGVVFTFTRAARSLWRTKNLVARACEPVPDRVPELTEQAARMMAVNPVPCTLVTNESVSPFVCGLRRSVIVIPARMVESVQSGELLAVLTHEMAHIRRRDPLLGVLLMLCDLGYFFHPVFLFARRQILFERERACDDLVLTVSKAKRSSYAKALLAAAEMCLTRDVGGAPPLVVAESFGDLRSRLSALPMNVNPRGSLSSRATAALLLLGVICVPGVALVARNAPAAATVENGASALPPSSSAPQASNTAPTADATAAPAAAPEVPVRIVRFPVDRAIGTLWKRPPQSLSRRYVLAPNYSGLEEWAFLAPAKGSVSVPANEDVMLKVNLASASADVASLNSLGANDLQALDVVCPDGATTNLDVALAPFLKGLTGLRTLTVAGGGYLTEAGLRYLEPLKALKELHLRMRSGSLDDAALSGLSPMESLEVLEVFAASSHFTEAGFAALTRLRALRELSICTSPGNEIEAKGLARLADLPRLEFLSCSPTRSTLAQVGKITSIKSLWLRHSHAGFGDADLLSVAQLTGLEELMFAHGDAGITDAGLSYLVPLQSLRTLELSDAKISDRGVASLARIKSLEELRLPGRPVGVTDRGLSYLTQLPNLRSLWTGGSSGCAVSDEGIRCVARIASLRELGLCGGNGITDAGLAALSSLKRLRSFYLLSDSPNITDQGLASLATMSSLKSLDLHVSNAHLSISGINQLGALTLLTSLNVSPVHHDDAVLDLSRLSQLEQLAVEVEPGLRDEDLACLAGLKNLKWLQSVSGITDKGMAHLAGLAAMERLNIYKSSVTDEGLKYLADMRQLNFLNIAGTISDAGLRHLTPLKALNWLKIDSPSNELSAEALAALQAELPQLTSLNAPTHGFGMAQTRTLGHSQR